MTLAALALAVMSQTAVLAAPLSLHNADFAQVGANGAPADWQFSSWYGCPVPHLTAANDTGRTAAILEFTQTAPVYTLALHQTLPDLPARGVAVVRFAYRAAFGGARQVSVAISGSPGCSLPCSRAWYTPTADDTWHDAEVRLPLPTAAPPGSVLEFTFNGEFHASDRFALSGVVFELEPPPLLTVGFTEPGSGVVFTDAGSQNVAGILRVPPDCPARMARVYLLSAASPDAPLEARALPLRGEVTPWQFDLAGRPEGKYAILADLVGRDGGVMAQEQLTAWHVSPTPETTRVVAGKVCQGSEPTLLFGTYHVCDFAVEAVNRESHRIGAPLTDREAMLKGLANVGLTGSFYSWGIPPQDFLDDASRLGHRLMPETAGLGREWGGAPLEQQVAPYADDRRIFAWYGSDEPSQATLPGAVQVYRDLKRACPRRMVVTSFCDPGSIDLLQGEALVADLVLLDIYDIRTPDADLSRVGQAVAQAVRYAKAHGGIAIGVAPQAFVFSGPEPTPEQLRAQVYLGLVNGAVAVFPYAYVEDYGTTPFAGQPNNPAGMSGNPARQRWWLPDSAMWGVMPRISQELRELSGPILHGTPQQAAAQPSPVQFLVTRQGDQRTLLAVNPQAGRNGLTLSLGPAAVGLEPLFGTPPVAAQGPSVALSFSGYEVKVFRLTTSVTQR